MKRTTNNKFTEAMQEIMGILVLLAFGWWAIQGFAERRELEADQRAAIIRAEGGMTE